MKELKIIDKIKTNSFITQDEISHLIFPDKLLDLKIINKIITDYYSENIDFIKIKLRRPKQRIHAKKIFCWLAYHNTGKSYKEIINYLGLENHSTALSHVKELDDKIFDKELRESKENIEQIFKNLYG